MQPNENFTFLFELTVLITLITFILRTIYLRSKRKTLVKKYKGSPQYKNVEILLSTKRFIIAQFLALVVCAKTVVDIKTLFSKYGEGAVDQLFF